MARTFQDNGGTVKLTTDQQHVGMQSRPSYRRHRFPPDVTCHAVCLYHRFTLSFRHVEDLLLLLDQEA